MTLASSAKGARSGATHVGSTVYNEDLPPHLRQPGWISIAVDATTTGQTIIGTIGACGLTTQVIDAFVEVVTTLDDSGSTALTMDIGIHNATTGADVDFLVDGISIPDTTAAGTGYRLAAGDLATLVWDTTTANTLAERTFSEPTELTVNVLTAPDTGGKVIVGLLCQYSATDGHNGRVTQDADNLWHRDAST